MRARYDHVQPAGALIAPLCFGAFLCGVFVAVALTSAPADRGVPFACVLGGTGVLLIVCARVLRSLRVTVTDAEVVAAFGSGWPRRRIAVRDVAATRPVRNPWWYGHGIRLTPRGWMLNASGADAVEIDLAGGGRFRIGTDDPGGLVAAVEEARAAAGRAAGLRGRRAAGPTGCAPRPLTSDPAGTFVPCP